MYCVSFSGRPPAFAMLIPSPGSLHTSSSDGIVCSAAPNWVKHVTTSQLGCLTFV